MAREPRHNSTYAQWLESPNTTALTQSCWLTQIQQHLPTVAVEPGCNSTYTQWLLNPDTTPPLHRQSTPTPLHHHSTPNPKRAVSPRVVITYTPPQSVVLSFFVLNFSFWLFCQKLPCGRRAPPPPTNDRKGCEEWYLGPLRTVTVQTLCDNIVRTYFTPISYPPHGMGGIIHQNFTRIRNSSIISLIPYAQAPAAPRLWQQAAGWWFLNRSKW